MLHNITTIISSGIIPDQGELFSGCYLDIGQIFSELTYVKQTVFVDFFSILAWILL